MWKTAEPVVGAWIADNLGPRGRMEDAQIAAAELARQVLQAPERLAKLGRWLDSWSEEPAPREPARRALGGAALWWIAIALIWIAARLTFAR